MTRTRSGFLAMAAKTSSRQRMGTWIKRERIENVDEELLKMEEAFYREGEKNVEDEGGLRR